METRFRLSLIARRLLQQEFTLQAIYLCFIMSFSSFVYKGQRFRERCESCLWLSHASICLGEQRQKIRSPFLCSCGTPGCQALVELLNPFLRLSLLRQRPAVQERTGCHPGWKSLFRGETDSGFRSLLGRTHLPTELMEKGSKAQDITQTRWVDHGLRQGHRLLVPCQPLLRIPQRPQRPGGMAAAHHACVLPIEERQGTVPLGIIKRYALC